MEVWCHCGLNQALIQQEVAVHMDIMSDIQDQSLEAPLNLLRRQLFAIAVRILNKVDCTALDWSTTAHCHNIEGRVCKQIVHGIYGSPHEHDCYH